MVNTRFQTDSRSQKYSVVRTLQSMPVDLDKNSIKGEITSKLPNEDEIMEYYQAGKLSSQNKEAYENYISQKYGEESADKAEDITGNLGGSDVAATKLRSQYGGMLSDIIEGIPKMIEAFKKELSSRVQEPVQMSSLSDIANFASESSYNKEALKESLISAVDRIGSTGGRLKPIIKGILKSISYALLKTVQTVSAVFMLSILAWPYLVVGWPIKGTAVIASAIIGLIGPAMIADKVDDRMFEGLK